MCCHLGHVCKSQVEQKSWKKFLPWQGGIWSFKLSQPLDWESSTITIAIVHLHSNTQNPLFHSQNIILRVNTLWNHTNPNQTLVFFKIMRTFKRKGWLAFSLWSVNQTLKFNQPSKCTWHAHSTSTLRDEKQTYTCTNYTYIKTHVHAHIDIHKHTHIDMIDIHKQKHTQRRTECSTKRNHPS